MWCHIGFKILFYELGLWTFIKCHVYTIFRGHEMDSNIIWLQILISDAIFISGGWVLICAYSFWGRGIWLREGTCTIYLQTQLTRYIARYIATTTTATKDYKKGIKMPQAMYKPYEMWTRNCCRFSKDYTLTSLPTYHINGPRVVFKSILCT